MAVAPYAGDAQAGAADRGHVGSAAEQVDLVAGGSEKAGEDRADGPAACNEKSLLLLVLAHSA